MAKIENIKSEELKRTIIDMQVDEDKMYYGFFAMYFNFVEKNDMGACAGVTIKNRQFFFYYNSELIAEQVEKDGLNFLKFLVIHECQHILLSHIQRTGERNHKISNIAQDMIINDMIKEHQNYYFEDFYYLGNDYKNLGWKANEFEGLKMYEEVYEVLIENQPEQDPEDGDGDGESQDGDGDGDGNGTPKDGKSKGKGKPQQGKLVDDHSMLNEDEKNMSSSDKAIVDSMIKDINESLKARGMNAGQGIENQFAFKKKKTIVNVFKRVFGNGNIKSPTYRKLSRRHNMLKGRKKESKDVNLVLDTSGSLYAELEEYLPKLVGNWNCYVVQVDTSVQFAGHVKNMAGWKKVAKKGGGGTILQPALDHLVEQNRHTIPTAFLSDFYAEELDLAKLKAPITFVKSNGAIAPKYRNNNTQVKIIESQLDTDGNQP